MGIKVRLGNVRLGFAQQLFVASAVEEGQTEKFGCDSLLVAGSTVHKQVTVDGAAKWVATTMKEVLLEVANEAMKGKGAAWMEALENSKKCYRDGDKRVTKAGDAYEGYEGIFYVAAKNKVRPLIIDQNKAPLTQADGKPYSGCYANVTIEVYAITDPKRKGVHAALKGVQFVKDGDAFGGGAPASPDDFETVDAGADADDLT